MTPVSLSVEETLNSSNLLSKEMPTEDADHTPNRPIGVKITPPRSHNERSRRARCSLQIPDRRPGRMLPMTPDHHGRKRRLEVRLTRDARTRNMNKRKTPAEKSTAPARGPIFHDDRSARSMAQPAMAAISRGCGVGDPAHAFLVRRGRVVRSVPICARHQRFHTRRRPPHEIRQDDQHVSRIERMSGSEEPQRVGQMPPFAQTVGHRNAERPIAQRRQQDNRHLAPRGSPLSRVGRNR